MRKYHLNIKTEANQMKFPYGNIYENTDNYENTVHIILLYYKTTFKCVLNHKMFLDRIVPSYLPEYLCCPVHQLVQSALPVPRDIS